MVHAFLEFELDEQRFELRSHGEVIATQGRVFAMIAYLLHARDRLVSKNELRRALWKDTVVSEAAISQVVMLARKALRDEGESQRVIRTFRGRGFRFIAPVRAREEPASAPTLRSAAPRAPAPQPRPPLLGRDAELRELSQQLAQLEAGIGGLMLIEGEPGIGKTTLAEELAARAAERGIEVLWGRAWEEGGAPPFWPWIQVLRAMTGKDDPARLRDMLGASAAELAPLLPELGATNERRQDTHALFPADDSRRRFRQFDAIARLLRQAGRALPHEAAAPDLGRARLVILDDLHAADDASIQLTRFLMPDLRDMGLLLIGTYRGLEVPSRPALGALVESCGRNTLHLRGLAPDEVCQLLAQRRGSFSPPRWAAALHRISAGNPLLIAELADRFESDDPGPLAELAQFADVALPERIASAVRRHLAELPAETRGVLSAASALGREFPLPLLSALHGCSEPNLVELLSPALRQGVVRPAANAPGRLVFSHALVCSTIYAQLSPPERLELHRKIAELLEQSGTAGRPSLYEIAHHLFLAASHGCRRKAIDYAQRAAAESYAMMAYETAAGLYDRALQLAELEPIDAAQSHDLMCGAGNAWYRSGELERACARFDAAARLARAEHAAERFAMATVFAANALRGSMLHDHKHQQQLREALALLPAGDSEVKALVLSGSMLGLRSAESLAERQNTTRAAIDMARRLGNDQILQWTLNARHLALWGAAPPQELIATASEMVELGRRAADRELLLDGLFWRMIDYGELGDAQALRDRQEYGVEAERCGSPWHRYMAAGCDTFEAMAYADFARARELSERTLALGLRIQDSLAEAFHAIRGLFFDFHQGVHDRSVHGQLQRVDPPSCVPTDYRPLWALSWAASGHTDVARNMLEQTMARASEHLLLDVIRRQTFAIMAQVCLLLRDAGPAEQLYRALLPSAGLQLHLEAFVNLGPADYYLGILADLLGRQREAIDHLTRALAQTRSPRPPFPYVQCEYGRILAAEDPGAARKLLAEVRETAEQLGMAGLRERARAALAQLAD